MCNCPEPDVMTEWTGYAGTEHHYCCDTTEDVRQDEHGNVIYMDDLYALYGEGST